MRIILHKIIDWIFDKSLLVSGISILLLSIIDISDINNWKIPLFGVQEFQIGRIIYYFVVLVAFVFGIISISHAKNISELESDIEEKGVKIIDLESALSEIVCETSDLFNYYIKLLVKNLDFTHHERVSVYKVYDNNFILIGRSSINPLLMEKGRPNYPIRDGFIGKGWAEGEFFVDDLPDPAAGSGTKYYNKVNEISPISRNIIDNLNMKSRTFFIYRINGFDNDPKAVLVFESELVNAFTKENILENLLGIEQPLIMFIEKNNGAKILDNRENGNNELNLWEN